MNLSTAHASLTSLALISFSYDMVIPDAVIDGEFIDKSCLNLVEHRPLD